MRETFCLDPDGDVILILRNPNVAFAAWEERQDYMPFPLVPPRRESPSPVEASYNKSKGKNAKSMFRFEPEPDIVEAFETLEPQAAIEFDIVLDEASEGLEFQADPDPDREPANVESPEALELDTFTD
ncbi:hypothetical protein V499_04358 [Pseudogymnoascus sp. VKM F-103]|nr:hypothetical protein V499_04358 [Pseudogymnoascus sp. VKM F-103]